ncbi:MAG: hypothetical protein ACP5N2_04810 [Candidatus Nanoarchaeia archaeon]
MELNTQTNEDHIDEKLEIAKKYFRDETVITKVVQKSYEVVRQFDGAYALFKQKPDEFKEFYKQKFRKDADSIVALSNEQDLYGVLAVKAKAIVDAIDKEMHAEELERFLDEDFKKMPTLRNGPKIVPRGSKSPSLGSWYSDDEPR